MNKTPVAFFGFNRPDCTKIVFGEIRRYQPEQLFLVADGPRTHVPTDAARCEAVRSIMLAVDWKCEIKTNYADDNLGCRQRMSSGLDWVFSQVEEAILLEDDCVPSPEFFEFCTQMLSRYRNDPRIMTIAGANFQAGRWRGDGSYYFSKYSHIWGWATWRRAWQRYDVQMDSWPQVHKNKWLLKMGWRRIERDYWNGIFEQVYAGKIDTWDFQWFYACLRHEGLNIVPNANLVTNIGTGPDATHTPGHTGITVPTQNLGEIRHPTRLSPDAAADKFTFDTQFFQRPPFRPFTRLRQGLSKLRRTIQMGGLTS